MLLTGEIGKPHGVSGETYVVSFSDDPQRFAPGAHLRHERGTQLVVESARPHKGGARLLVKFVGIDDRASAEAMRGALYVAAEGLRELEEDEYWTKDLVGCRVELPSGAVAGEVTNLVEGPAQDLLEVSTERGPRLVPLVKAIVVEVDVERSRIVIDPPEGLLD